MVKNQANRLVDIARLSGVSIGTVDRVIHNRGRVSAEAREKVSRAIEALEYKPNILARTLRLQSTVRSSILLPDHRDDEYWKQAINGINSEIGKWSHYGVKIQIHTYNPYSHDSFKMAVDSMNHEPFDGVVLAPVFHDLTKSLLSTLHDKDVPYVLFDSNIPELAPLSFAGQDLYASGRIAADLLFKSVDNIGTTVVIHMMEDPDGAPHLREKERGFAAYLAENGEEAVYYPLATGQPQSLTRLAEVLSDPALSRVYVTNSRGTTDAGKVLQQLGRTDVVLVGYDLLADNVRMLRTGHIKYLINQNPGRLARTALANLFTHLVLGQEVPSTELFPLDIITRENVDSYLRFQS